jgi:hypothetical protein
MKNCYTFLRKNWLRFGLAAAAATFTLSASAQIAPAKQWDKTFGGSSTEILESIQQTSDGGYIVGGSSDSGISGDKSQTSKGGADYWIVKVDANGTKTWDKTFGGSAHDQLYSLQQTSDGGYILGGLSYSGISGDKSQPCVGVTDFWVIKLDANGNKTWDKTFGGNNIDLLSSLKQTSDGGYILGGSSTSGISGDKSEANKGFDDYWIIKLDANGNKIWDKTFGGNMREGLTALQQTSDGGYILGGTSNSGINGDKSQALIGEIDYWIVKLDANGNKTWDKTFGGINEDGIRALQQTSDGGYILGGSSDSGISGDKSEVNKGNFAPGSFATNDYWVVKLDASGNKVWDKTFGGNTQDLLFSIQQTSDGGYALSGRSDSGISGDKSEASKGLSDFWVLKLNGAGNKVWDKTLGGVNEEELHSLQQTSDGGYILAGYSNSGISGDKSQICLGSQDFWVVKLAPDVLGVKESKSSFNLSISPNPNQGKFKLQLSNLSAPTTEITVSDLLGRKVLQKEFQTTSNLLSEELTLPNAKGMYLLQIKAGNQTATHKIVVE